MWVRLFDIVSIPIATDGTGIVEASEMLLMYRMNNVDWELMFVLLHFTFSRLFNVCVDKNYCVKYRTFILRNDKQRTM